MLGMLHRPGVKRNAWLKALLKPFEVIHNKFLVFTDARLDEVSYNGQTFVLEQMLISKFGAGIYITNNVSTLDSNVIGAGSDWSDAIGAGSDFNGGIGVSYAPTLYDFTVNVPGSIIFVQSEMEAWIRKYNGNSFNIVII
jgi:hypothetical protein